MFRSGATSNVEINCVLERSCCGIRLASCTLTLALSLLASPTNNTSNGREREQEYASIKDLKAGRSPCGRVGAPLRMRVFYG